MRLGKYEIENPLVLGPMAGVTDWAFRTICAQLGANITVTEMLFAAQRIAGRTYQHMAMYIEVALIYLAFSTILTKVQKWGEQKLNYYGGA